MSDKLATPRRFRGIRKKISGFLLTAVVVFVGVIALVGYKQGMFVKHTHVYFHAPDASGINKGMSVRLYGVPVGAVKDIEILERGGVRVRIGINTDYLPLMPRGSQARLVREGVVGAASIQIVSSPTSLDRTPVAEGEVLKFIPHRSMNEMVDELRQQMAPAFQELRKAVAEMTDPQGDFRRSVSSVRELIEELPGTTRDLRQLLRDTDRTMIALGRQADTVGKQADAALATITRVGLQAEEHLPVLAGKLATTLDSLNATSEQLRVTTRENGEALRELLAQAPELMRGGGELVRDSQELTAAARRSWLLRDYVEPLEMRTLPVDSFESFGKR